MTCQFVDCRDEAIYTELWRIGEARVFVQVCQRHGISSKAGSRTSIERGAILREEGQAVRGEVA